MDLSRLGRVIAMVAGLVAAFPAASQAQAKADPLPSPPPVAVQSLPKAPAPIAPVPPPIVASATATEVKPVALTRMVVKMEAGEPFLVMQSGYFCGNSKTVTWNGGRTEQNVALYQDVFREKLEAAGLKVQGPSDNLFDTPTASADYVVAGLIKQELVHICVPNTTDANRVKGDLKLTIQWELYSTLEHRMLATVQTSSEVQQPEAELGGIPAMNMKAFGANVVQLAASASFRQALTGVTHAAGDLITADAQAHIPLPGAITAPLRPATDEVGSVVVLLVGSTSGSGVLVSNDGYILTDAHVVSEAKEVKVRWSDGLETVGKVVRTIKGRDVALVRSEGRGRDPVPFRTAPVEVGETVYAVGAPLGEKFQGTVTRGIVSAKRILDGYAYIQSDVSVTHGSSGGPLLDDKGRLLGLTVMGIPFAGIIPTGINLFIPIKDAVDFLALDPR